MALGGQQISDGGAGSIQSGPGFSASASERDIVFFDDFFVGGFIFDDALTGESKPAAKFVDFADVGEWLVTFDILPTIVIANAERGGLLVITTGSNSNDFCSCQHNGEAWAVAAQKDIYFEMRVKFDDANDTRWFVGLCGPEVASSTVGPILDVIGSSESMIGFFQNTDTGTDIQIIVQNGGTETTISAGVDVVDNIYLLFAYRVKSNDSVEFFINGNSVGEITTNMPDADPMTLSMEVHSPTASSTIEADYIYCSQIR